MSVFSLLSKTQHHIATAPAVQDWTDEKSGKSKESENCKLLKKSQEKSLDRRCMQRVRPEFGKRSHEAEEIPLQA
ncbi:MAG: hypothetical protein Q9194_004560 [Teloschistes cf. exilis]